MAVTINASTTAGLVQTADTTGNLNLQSNGTTIAALTSTGLAVTGAGSFSTTLGVTGAANFSSTGYFAGATLLVGATTPLTPNGRGATVNIGTNASGQSAELLLGHQGDGYSLITSGGTGAGALDIMFVTTSRFSISSTGAVTIPGTLGVSGLLTASAGAVVSWTGGTGLTLNRVDGAGFLQLNKSNGVTGSQISDSGAGAIMFFTDVSGTPTLNLTVGLSGVTIPGTLGLGSAGTAKLNIVGVSATSTEYALYVTNSTPTLMFGVRDDGYMNIGTAASSPYNNTSASSANLFVDSNGSLFRSTSSLKYKENLQDLTLTEAQTITFGRHAFSYSSKTETSDRRYIGYGAEEIAPVDSRFAQLDADGIPDGVAYDRFVIPHGIILSDHESRLTALQADFQAYKQSHP